MKRDRRVRARADETYGVIHRDYTDSYEYAMFKKYGYNWKKKLRELAKNLRPKGEDRD